jgi:uncharacterized protein involved in response to NO
MTLALFRVAFLVMLERTLTQFMKNALQADILRNPRARPAIKLLALVLVFASLLPPQISSWLALLLALLLSVRFVFWKPLLACAGSTSASCISATWRSSRSCCCSSSNSSAQPAWLGSLSMHVFTFGAMGLIIPAMLIRIANGHTGRKVVFDRLDKSVLWIMIAGFVIRIVVPQIDPAGYLRWISLAAACWFACFAILGWRYIPYLLQAAGGRQGPRVRHFSRAKRIIEASAAMKTRSWRAARNSL